MNTWDAQKCSDIALSQNPDFGQDIGIVAYLNGLGGSLNIFADIQHAGWRDIDFSGGIIASTFTFAFIDTAGNFTDIDNNGKSDTYFREIYYDPSFVWGSGDANSFDVETVALHEAGHALSQGHFGTVSFKKGVLSAKPRAVMNAIYSGSLRDLKGTDNGGHCSNWAQWPNN